MARVTIEDCIPKVENRFKLVLVAAQRARDILNGAPKLMIAEDDKPDVLALREIGAGMIDVMKLNEDIIKRHQKHQALMEEDKIDDSQVGDLFDESAALESGNQQEIITNMYASESYDDGFDEAINQD